MCQWLVTKTRPLQSVSRGCAANPPHFPCEESYIFIKDAKKWVGYVGEGDEEGLGSRVRKR